MQLDHKYTRLLHIEKKYLELEKKYNARSSKNSENLEGKNTAEREDVNNSVQQVQSQNQIGHGQVPNNIANFAKLVAQFMLKENNDQASTKPERHDCPRSETISPAFIWPKQPR
jgi:hypothetical protein